MTIALTALICFGAVASLAFVGIYGFGAQWWANRIGRSLVAQGFAIGASLTWSAVRRLSGAAIALTGGTAVAALAVFSAIAVIEAYLAWSFWREIRAARRRATQQTSHYTE